MNHEGEASSSASHAYDGSVQSETTPTVAELNERRKNNRRMFNRKRVDLLDSLMRDLDMLIYAELAATYYMDCSFLRFALRALVQFMYLTPKHAPLPEHPAEKPMLGAILGGNVLSLLLHLCFAAPSAGESTRGYLHGGLAMDFIGQAGPTSKVHLVLLDLLVLSFQIMHMAVYMVRSKLKRPFVPGATTSHSNESRPQQTAAAPEEAGLRQDLDAEERGVIRADEQQDIEMQTLNPASREQPPEDGIAGERPSIHTALLPTAPQTDAHIFDAFHSGQIVIADLDLRKRCLEQIGLAKSYRAHAEASGTQRLRSEMMNRLLRMRMGADALRQNI